MTLLTDFDLNDDGKIDLDAIYNQPDPRGYYQTLFSLDYRIPAAAEPLFRRAIRAFRDTRRRRDATILDVGSSYGVNAAILKHGYPLSELFRLYAPTTIAGIPPRELIERDRSLFNGGRSDASITAIGLDSASKAIAYASAAGILDNGIAVDFERREPTAEEAAQLAPVDLVVSTGAIGYVGAPTFSRILDAAPRQPWLAVFVLRMFPITRIAAMLKRRGYAVFKLDGQTFRQRRFANRKERGKVIARLEAIGIDPAGLESDGWLHAEFFLAKPSREGLTMPLPDLTRI